PELGKFENQLELTQSEHGRRLIQVVWNLTKVELEGGEVVGPKIVALNARQLNHFRRFTKFITHGLEIDGKKVIPDVVLFANAWEV
ncbi:hypothetical protein ACI3PL_26000, partial [Lacticaseibacillus paracasei]